jgi:ATP-dependent Clp protease ATP-binding subunit ClpA
VVLVDEVEKGHLDVMNLFYQVFDKGMLTEVETWARNIDYIMNGSIMPRLS